MSGNFPCFLVSQRCCTWMSHPSLWIDGSEDDIFGFWSIRFSLCLPPHLGSAFSPTLRHIALNVDPFDTFRAIPDAILKVVCNTLMMPPLEVMKSRLRTISQWRHDAEQLSQANNNIFENMDTGCAAVLKGKRLALLEKIATDIAWPDQTIHQEIRNGFRLVGQQSPSGIIAADIKPRSLSGEELIAQSKFIKPALWGKNSHGQTNDYDEGLWNITMSEVHDKRWLSGPYTKDELDVLLGDSWIPVRRFAVYQRDKWRAIDDFSECGVNSSFAYFERVDLKALDEIIWTACLLTKFVLRKGYIDFELSDGERLAGPVNQIWSQLPADNLQLVAKTVDLRSAYKQFPITPDNRRFSVLALRKPSTAETFGFISRTLPFGSVASVLHFNRVARLVHKIGLEAQIMWFNYYDDYPVVDFKVLSEHTTAAIRPIMS